MFKELKENRNGFTLIELTVVLVILGILAAILVPSLMGFVKNAKEKQYVMEAQGVRKTIQMYMVKEYAGKELDQLDIYEELTGFSLNSNKNPLYDYLTVKCSKGAQLGGLTIDMDSMQVLEMVYEVDGYVITLGDGDAQPVVDAP